MEFMQMRPKFRHWNIVGVVTYCPFFIVVKLVCPIVGSPGVFSQLDEKRLLQPLSCLGINILLSSTFYRKERPS